LDIAAVHSVDFASQKSGCDQALKCIPANMRGGIGVVNLELECKWAFSLPYRQRPDVIAAVNDVEVFHPG
jgi:hypothetical protein